MGRGVYEMNNQPKKSTFKYEQEGRFCLGVAIEQAIKLLTILLSIYEISVGEFPRCALIT